MREIENFVFSNPETYEMDVNEMLSFELIKNDELSLHIDDVRDLPYATKWQLLREGLTVIANLLQVNPLLKNVKTISGTSWIVSKNPKFTRSLGFEIVEDLASVSEHISEYKKRKKYRLIHKDEEPGYAHMDREKFLDLYGKTMPSL